LCISGFILAHQWPAAFGRASQVKVLSRDWPDMLWRGIHMLAGAFIAPEGVNQGHRIVCEPPACKLIHAERSLMGAMIDQISESSRSNADEAAMVAAIMAELEVEARCRFECARTITLMRAAKAKSMRLIIATDKKKRPREAICHPEASSLVQWKGYWTGCDPNYRSSERTFCCDWFAWASIAVEACERICDFANAVVSAE